jgi:hypothetical protein
MYASWTGLTQKALLGRIDLYARASIREPQPRLAHMTIDWLLSAPAWFLPLQQINKSQTETF